MKRPDRALKVVDYAMVRVRVFGVVGQDYVYGYLLPTNDEGPDSATVMLSETVVGQPEWRVARGYASYHEVPTYEDCGGNDLAPKLYRVYSITVDKFVVQSVDEPDAVEAAARKALVARHRAVTLGIMHPKFRNGDRVKIHHWLTDTPIDVGIVESLVAPESQSIGEPGWTCQPRYLIGTKIGTLVVDEIDLTLAKED